MKIKQKPTVGIDFVSKTITTDNAKVRYKFNSYIFI